MDRFDFINSYKGRMLRYKGRSKRSFLVQYKTPKLQTKKSARKEDNRKFQRAVLDLLKTRNRRCFRSDVAVEIYFKSNQKNPPAIQSLLKHYLDLIQENAALHTNRNFLIIKDDAQIKALSSWYFTNDRKATEQEISISIRPMRDFILDLEFAEQMKLGLVPGLIMRTDDDLPDFESKLDSLDERIRDERKLEKLLRISGKFVGNGSYLKYLKEARSANLLEWNSTKGVGMLLQLLGGRPETQQEVAFDKDLGFASTLLLQGPYSMSFGRVPVKKGDSKHFRKEINEILNKWFEQNSTILPLGTNLTIKVFYERPRKVNHDLDNLIRCVLPHFDEVINERRARKSTVNVEIYEIETQPENSETGHLYLKIESLSENNIFQLAHDIISHYSGQS